jgi:ubiquinol-cytochrome c reductase cytochrome c1 subunit
MFKNNKIILAFLYSILFSGIILASDGHIILDKANVNCNDYASLQRGAKIYMTTCATCHSIKYVRYKELAKQIEIVDGSGDILVDVVQNGLMYSGGKITDNIVSALSEKDGQKWFGKSPPDLSLVARSRGVDWIYTYLRSFYKDDNKIWGVNNIVFPDVAMPHVLLNYQGLKGLSESNAHDNNFVNLKLIKQGSLNETEYDLMVLDLVNFLSYVGEPHQVARKRLGVWVLIFLSILLVFTYLLKREYWKDIK